MRRDHILFGAAYYHEYQPHDRTRSLKEDLDLMAEAQFTVIRVGESVWSTWEPENGRFDLDWLQPVLDGAHERGIRVVVGTPTYAVPPWLARQYPEIAGVHRDGQRIGWGARQEADFTHPAFRFHAERVIRKICERYTEHPAVIGWQADNEPGLELLYNHGVFQHFLDELRQQYGDVENLNRQWGLVYWSHQLTTWADLWTPEGNSLPQYDLAWRRFQSRLTTEFIAWQASIIREYAQPGQFVTTCISYDRAAADDEQLAKHLDVTAGNPYYAMQDGLALPDSGNDLQGWASSGTWALYQAADRMYASRQEPFLVTETNASSIGGSAMNYPAFPGQWRQAAWALVSRGASMIEYWHWHSLHYGPETYWGGILPHSGRPGRAYRELAQLGHEFQTAGELVTDLRPDADAAILFCHASKWAMENQPPLSTPDGVPDVDSYRRIVGAFYRGGFDAGLQMRIVYPDQLADASNLPPVLIVPAYYAADDALLDRLAAFAAGGCHVILGPRTAYADTEARARSGVQPSRLSEAAGVWYDEFSNLGKDLPVRGAIVAQADSARATGWAEGLIVSDAEVLVEYEHPHFGGFPAVTTRRHGSGRVTCVGTVPNPALAEALFRWAGSQGDPWRTTIPSVTSTAATARDGRRVRFLHNWSWRDTTFPVPCNVRDLLTGSVHTAGESLNLGPWDVRVLVESDHKG